MSRRIQPDYPLRMASSLVRTQIRIPTDLYERIVEAAEASSRSLNAEMVVRLESSFRFDISPGQSTSEPAQVKLRPFQQQLFETVRKIVRMEALLGAPKLTPEQKAELEQLKSEIGLTD